MLPKLFLSQLEFTTKFETCKEAMSKLTFSKVGFNATGILKHQASSKIDVALELVELIQMYNLIVSAILHKALKNLEHFVGAFECKKLNEPYLTFNMARLARRFS